MLAHARRIGMFAFVFGLALLTAGPAAAQQVPAGFMGEWELDRFKSIYEPINTAPQKQLVTIASAPMGQFSVATRTWRGEVANETRYTAAPDGRDYATSAAQATVAFKLVNPTTLERTAKLMNQLSETATWSLSADGKLLTIKREGTDAQGTPFSSTAYYNKIR